MVLILMNLCPTTRLWKLRFRPLAGIMVLIATTSGQSADSKFPFPSPCGDYGSYLKRERVTTIPKGSVSVPLRGLWFLSPATAPFPLPIRGFRPLAGIMVLISRKPGSRDRCPGFRPLAGIMVLILGVALRLTFSTICFRPLAGIMVLISVYS